MRAIWSGLVSFGLINIPVKLYAGSESRGGIELNMVRKSDLSPIGYKKVAKIDEREVSFGEIVKAYEYQPGEYVVVDEHDLEKATAKRTKTIDIQEFTNEAEIDVRYFDRPYYLEPDRGADKPYALLRQALQASRKVAVARFVLRNREHLAAIKPIGDALILNQMRFPSEIRSPAGLKLPDAKAASPAEIDMATELVEKLTRPFIPEDFHDTYTEQLESVIEAKVKGRQTQAEPAPATTTSKDLMAALKASLEQGQAKD